MGPKRAAEAPADVGTPGRRSRRKSKGAGAEEPPPPATPAKSEASRAQSCATLSAGEELLRKQNPVTISGALSEASKLCRSANIGSDMLKRLLAESGINPEDVLGKQLLESTREDVLDLESELETLPMDGVDHQATRSGLVRQGPGEKDTQPIGEQDAQNAELQILQEELAHAVQEKAALEQRLQELAVGKPAVAAAEEKVEKAAAAEKAAAEKAAKEKAAAEKAAVEKAALELKAAKEQAAAAKAALEKAAEERVAAQAAAEKLAAKKAAAEKEAAEKAAAEKAQAEKAALELKAAEEAEKAALEKAAEERMAAAAADKDAAEKAAAQ